MLEAARKAMFPPFQISLVADPAGSFTTAAAMVACAGRQLKADFGADWTGRRVAVLRA